MSARESTCRTSMPKTEYFQRRRVRILSININLVLTSHFMPPQSADSYALGIVLLELLTGLGAKRIVGMMFDDADFFSTLDQHKDARAESAGATGVGAWPRKVVSGLVATAASCLEFRSVARAKVHDVLPTLKALAREHGQAGQRKKR
jgi:hypothetical protein